MSVASVHCLRADTLNEGQRSGGPGCLGGEPGTPDLPRTPVSFPRCEGAWRRWRLTWWFRVPGGQFWKPGSRGCRLMRPGPGSGTGSLTSYSSGQHSQGAHPDPRGGGRGPRHWDVFSPLCEFSLWTVSVAITFGVCWSLCVLRSSESIDPGCGLGICTVSKSSRGLLKCGRG